MCNLPKDHYVQVPWTKGHWPLDDLWPQVCWGHMCDSTQGSLWLSPKKIHQSMWIQLPFFQKKNWTKVHWLLDNLWPQVCWGHMWLYPRIIVSKSHENTPKYVDTVTFFSKTWTKGHWPLDDLWPHIYWGHMCDSTQESLCPSPGRGNTSMYVDTVINFAKYHIHTAYRRYILRTEWVITYKPLSEHSSGETIKAQGCFCKPRPHLYIFCVCFSNIG